MLSEVVDQIIERGKEEGHADGLRETAPRMLAKGYAINDVVEITGLELDEVRDLAQDLDSERE